MEMDWGISGINCVSPQHELLGRSPTDGPFGRLRHSHTVRDDARDAEDQAISATQGIRLPHPGE